MVNVWPLPYTHLCDFGIVAARADPETLAVLAALPFPSQDLSFKLAQSKSKFTRRLLPVWGWGVHVSKKMGGSDLAVKGEDSLHQVLGKMSTEDSGNGTSPTPPLLELLVPTMELVPPSATSPEVTDWLHVIVGLVCIFLVLATFLIFVTLCKPASLGRSLSGTQEWLPHHPVDASEPQLRLWKRLGSLRCSISSFRRSQLVSQSPLAHPRSFSTSQDRDTVESTKM